MEAIAVVIGILFLGICLGTFSKYLDYRQAELPYVLQIIDRTLNLHNFLGSFAPWMLIAVCIAVYSRTPVAAAIHVFLFFAGMVSSYYLYCNFVAGFFPKSYAMIWAGLTILSPFLACICWYAKGKGTIALLLSAGIVSAFINTAFAYGMFYISVSSWLNVIVLLIGVLVLRKPAKEMLTMIGAGIILAVILETLIPFYIW